MGRRERQVVMLGMLGRLLTWSSCAAEAQDSLPVPGLPWVRFNSTHFVRPRDTGVSEQIDIDTGSSFNDYSCIWIGAMQIPTDLPIVFSAAADNGLRLLMDDTPVIDGWATEGDRQGTFQAPAGTRVPLRLEYYQDGGVGYLRLYWQWKGHARERVPAAAFCHTLAQRRHVEAMGNGETAAIDVEDRSIIYQPNDGIPGPATGEFLPVASHLGPHLLLDEYLIAESIGLERVVLQPQREPALPNPIVTGPEDGCFQPYLTVLRAADTGRWRLWYGARREDRRMDRSHLATMVSADGIHFVRPHQVCDTPEIQFGSGVIDRGAVHPDPTSRYVYSYWLGGGTRLLASADGLTWRPLVQGVVLPHNHDITGIDWDPLRGVYVATVSSVITGAAWSGTRRTTMMSFSRDLIHWQKPWYVLTANDALDEGETQFYAMDGYLTRGPLRIGMVKVLRDDLRAVGTEPGSFGRAHTSLAWSRDGRTWIRDRARFFEPDDDPQAWDHAHAWIDEQVVVDDRVYLYYGGYKQGHKTNRFEERQIGLVRMPLDRYVARRAPPALTGRLTTVPIRLEVGTQAVQVNANAAAGQIRVQVRDVATGNIVSGMAFADCDPISGDALRQPVHWRGAALADVAGATVQLEFEITAADLFAFEFIP